MRGLWCGVILACAAGGIARTAPADEPAAGEAVITDTEGKEHKLSGLKFAAGTRRLAWLADPAGSTEDAKKGPLALQFRESMSAMPLSDGIVTFIPVDCIEAMQVDFEKELLTLNIKGLSQPLTGLTGYPRVNVLGMSGSHDGKAASFTLGTRGKPTAKSAAFGGATAAAKRKAGITWNIQILSTKADTPKVETPTLIARNLKVLYSFPGGAEQAMDAIPVRKGEALSFDDNLKRFEILATDLTRNVAVAEVETAAGPERVVVIPPTVGEDKKTGTLVGILGEVDAGWKLFPLSVIKVIAPSKRKIE